MTDIRIERGVCRFVATKNVGVRPTITLVFLRGAVPVLNHATLSLNLLGTLTVEQARKIADVMNENVLDVSIAVFSEHPMFAIEDLAGSRFH
jgi:hypothetical protein